jgi:hypothetical protein
MINDEQLPTIYTHLVVDALTGPATLGFLGTSGLLRAAKFYVKIFKKADWPSSNDADRSQEYHLQYRRYHVIFRFGKVDLLTSKF